MKTEILALLKKKSPDELQEYFHFRKRAFSIEPRRGKRAYSRKSKYKKFFEIF